MKAESEGAGTTAKPDIPDLAPRYFRPHAWAYGVAMLLAAVLALNSLAGWIFWPMMVWTILFLVHFLVVKSLGVNADWVAERTEDTAKRAFDISHIESIQKSYKERASRGQDGDKAQS